MPAHKDIHVLVVDDDTNHRNMLRLLLGEWGYTVRCAQDGAEAVTMCHEHPFDLILMDIRMPKLTGLEALKQIKQHNPAITVVMMTAYSEVETAVEAIKNGAYDYHTKPLDFEKLKINLEHIFSYRTLEKENQKLHTLLAQQHRNYPEIIGTSASMAALLTMVRTIAPSEATVLITGESGTGKEIIAKYIHACSERYRGPFIAINCAALTESLLESELFGHEKGAFTGAEKRREGRFVAANKGTLFLDEIGEMPLAMQAKLLRVLQEREVQPVGSDTSFPVDVRIIAATNKDLTKQVANKQFREDLYYRLHVVSLEMPPLRERHGDIPLLANFFAQKFAHKNNKTVKGFTSQALDKLIRYTWPGNVRELENTIERAVVLLIGEYISEKELPPQLLTVDTTDFSQSALPTNLTLEELERQAIMEVLANTGNNKSEAARRLGITRKTLHSKLQRYALE